MPPSTLTHGYSDLENRADEDAAQEADLRRYLLTPEGQAALAAGKLDEWLDDEGMENDGD